MGKANEFFGIDFGSKPTVSAPAEQQPQEGIVSRAMSFFGIDFRGGSQKPSKTFALPSVVPPSGMESEQQAVSAAVIKPSERQPDTQSLASNIAELKTELAKNTSPEAKKILTAELNKLLRK